MKLLICAAAVAVMGCGAANAQSAQQRYQGTFFVTDASGGCTTDDGVVAQPNEHYVFVFRTDNDGQAMSIIGQRRALAFVAQGARFARSGNFQGTYIPAGAVPRQRAGRYSQFKITPARLAGDTASIAVSGKLADFEGIEGCTVTFEAGGVRRPGF
jgi:hypothetical protein